MWDRERDEEEEQEEREGVQTVTVKEMTSVTCAQLSPECKTVFWIDINEDTGIIGYFKVAFFSESLAQRRQRPLQ